MDANQLATLKEENVMLRHEVQVAREAANITAQLVIRQFEETDKVLQRLQVANSYLNALHETTLKLMGRLELADLLETLVTRAGALVGTSHGYIYLLEPDEAEMKQWVGTGVLAAKANYRLKLGEGLVGRVWQTGQTLVLEDYGAWEHHLEAFKDVPLRAIIGMPLKAGSQVVGVIGLAYIEEGRKFGEDEIAVLGRFAGLASIALDNARLYAAVQRELIERKRAQAAEQEALRREIDVARNIQMSLLPQALPNIPGTHIVGLCVPAREVGGDLYGYYELQKTDLNPQGGYAIAIGDVTGKGIPAALYMAVSTTILAARAPFVPDVAQLLGEINTILYPYMSPNQMNTALCYVRLEPEPGNHYTAHIGNAGLIAPILKRGTQCEYLDVSGLPLGIKPAQSPYRVLKLPLQPGDVLVLSSDGVVEAKNTVGEMYSFERLLARVSSAACDNTLYGCAHKIHQWILADVLTFIGDVELHDDLTFIVMVKD